MSVVVRMEMPKGCWDCPCVNGEYGYCQADKEERTIEDPVCARKSDGRPSWCPIICSIPEGHGRLIDADKLKAKKYHSNITHENAVAVAEIDWAETIVPAEAERSET